MQKHVFDENREQEQPTLQGCKHFQKGELKKEGRHIHFTRGLASQILTVEPIGSANDICTFHGICAHHGENQEDRKKWSRSGLDCSPPGFSESESFSRAPVRDNLSCYAWLAVGNHSARASTIEGDMSTVSERIAAGSLSQIPKKTKSTKAVVEKANAVKDIELVRICGVASCPGTLNFGRYLRTRPSSKSLAKLTGPCEEFG